MAYKRTDSYDENQIASDAARYRELLNSWGEDPEREGLVKTPERAAKAIAFLTSGY